MDKHTSTSCLLSTPTGFPFFCYYSYDIEDGIDATKNLEGLGGADFVAYNILLLWVLPPLPSMTIQLCVLFGFLIIIQIALMITDWIASVWEESGMPGIPLPVILVSTYAIIVDFITQNVDIDNANILC
jgi:hypothetical protein